MSPERMRDEAAGEVRGGAAVLAVYHGAWTSSLDIWERLYEDGLNPYLYMPVDPLEAGLAQGLGLAGVVAAKAGYMASTNASRASRILEPSRLLPEPGGGEGAPRVYAPTPILRSAEACIGLKGCSLCVESCPYDAIQGKPPRVDPYKCVGCGLCTASCPLGLLEMPSHTRTGLEYMLDYAVNRGAAPGRIIYVCRSSLPQLAETLQGLRTGYTVLFLPVDCPGWLTPQDALAAVARGFEPAVYCDTDTIRECGALPDLRGLQPLPVHPEPVTSPRGLEELLGRIPRAQPLDVNLNSVPRPRLVHLLASRYDAGVIRLGAPIIGMAYVDRSRCLVCDACASACPYGALKLRVEGDRIKLVFDHSRCVACHLCEWACPYDAIRVEHEYRAGAYGRRVELAEYEVARCRRCGAPLGSMKMMRHVEEKLRKAGAKPLVLEQLWLCPRCKIYGLAED